MIKVEYMLVADRDPYYKVVLGDDMAFEELSHWEALARVKQISKMGNVDVVYDETYDATFRIVKNKILDLVLPEYFEEYRSRYGETFNGTYKIEPLAVEEDELVV